MAGADLPTNCPTPRDFLRVCLVTWRAMSVRFLLGGGSSMMGDGLWFNVSDVGLVSGVGGPQVKASAFTWGFAD